MRRPDHIPDPAFGDTDLDRAATEIVGHMGHQGDAQTMPASYGPAEGAAPEDHNSGAIWNAYGET